MCLFVCCSQSVVSSATDKRKSALSYAFTWRWRMLGPLTCRHYSSHSFRIGAAIQDFAIQCKVAFLTYIRIPRDHMAHMTRSFMGLIVDAGTSDRQNTLVPIRAMHACTFQCQSCINYVLMVHYNHVFPLQLFSYPPADDASLQWCSAGEPDASTRKARY